MFDGVHSLPDEVNKKLILKEKVFNNDIKDKTYEKSIPKKD